MRVNNVVKRFGSGSEQRARAIREIGLELSKRRTEVLSDLRSGIAQTEVGADEFERGYRDAVLDVLAAYEAAISQDGDLDESLQAIETRAHWPETLAALAPGLKRPADIVSELGLDAAVVSRALAALSELQLVELLPVAEGQDKRSRFYRLTLKGERLAERMERPKAIALQPLVRAAAMFFAELATRRRVIRSELEADVRHVVERPPGEVRNVVESLISVAKDFSLVHENEDGNLLIASEMTAQNRLAQELESYLRDRKPSPAVAKLRESVPTNCEVLVRCAKLRDSWNQVLVEKFGEYPDARTIDATDVSAEGFVPTPRTEFALVYDNVTLFKTDLNMENPAMRELQQRAAIRLCIGSTHAQVPDGWTLMPVAESY